MTFLPLDSQSLAGKQHACLAQQAAQKWGAAELGPLRSPNQEVTNKITGYSSARDVVEVLLVTFALSSFAQLLPHFEPLGFALTPESLVPAQCLSRLLSHARFLCYDPDPALAYWLQAHRHRPRGMKWGSLLHSHAECWSSKYCPALRKEEAILSKCTTGLFALSSCAGFPSILITREFVILTANLKCKSLSACLLNVIFSNQNVLGINTFPDTRLQVGKSGENTLLIHSELPRKQKKINVHQIQLED